MAFFIMAAYAIFASMWMFYLTDGDARQLRLVFSGVTVAGVGTWIAMYLAKRKQNKDARK